MVVKRSIQAIFFIGIIIFALWLGIFAQDSDFVKGAVTRYGYAGIFFAAIVSGFNLLAPVPIIAFLPLFVVSGLNQWATVALIVAGVTIADMLAYYLGRIGKSISPINVRKKAEKLNLFLENYRNLSLVALFFFAALVPMPNELLVLPMAFFGYRFFPVFIAVILGNTVFNVLSMLGVINIFELL